MWDMSSRICVTNANFAKNNARDYWVGENLEFQTVLFSPCEDLYVVLPDITVSDSTDFLLLSPTLVFPACSYGPSIPQMTFLQNALLRLITLLSM